MAKTPKRAGRQPRPGSSFPEQVVAENVAARRRLHGQSQAGLAGQMRELGHAWSRATVSEVERGDRNVTVAELLALALALDAGPMALLDPTEGDRGNGPDLDLGGPEPVDRWQAHLWLRGLVVGSPDYSGPDVLGIRFRLTDEGTRDDRQTLRWGANVRLAELQEAKRQLDRLDAALDRAFQPPDNSASSDPETPRVAHPEQSGQEPPTDQEGDDR